MRLFVTGATGFVGSHFLAAALRAGHDVRALRRPGSVPRVAVPHDVTWVDGTLADDLRDALTGCAVLVHLAAHTPNPPYDTLEACRRWNVEASLRLAWQAHQAGVQAVVCTGTAFEYGAAAARYDAVPPDAPLEAEASYPVSKVEACRAFVRFAQETGARVRWLRLFQVYGEGEAPQRLWPALRRAALAGEDFPMSDGSQVRDFVSVTGVAQALLTALDVRDVPPGSPLIANLGTGRGTSVADFARRWWSHWGAQGSLQIGALPRRPHDVARLVAAVDPRLGPVLQS